MESRLLQLNGQKWRLDLLGERALLLTLEADTEDALPIIQQTLPLLEKQEVPDLLELVPAYDSIALIFDNMIEEPAIIVSHLENIGQKQAQEYLKSNKGKLLKVPVCYELGLDWDFLEDKFQLSKNATVSLHTEPIYKVAMLGFLPGFVYLSGLKEQLFCERKENPRTKVPQGSVGIGGTQTGIYSLECPGGWQIIGRTPMAFFDAQNNPPCPVKMGDQIQFYAISETEFYEY